MTRRWGVLVALVGVGVVVCAAPALADAAPTVYVVNNGGFGSVVPIDAATGTAGSSIPVGDTLGTAPHGIAITPDGKTAYVANQGSNSVTPIDIATGTPGTPIPVGSGPSGIATTPDGKTVYVANSSSQSVTPIDTATNTAGPAIPIQLFPEAIAITPDGKTAYVASGGITGLLTPIDTATNTLGAPLAFGGIPGQMAITPDGKTVYVIVEVTQGPDAGATFVARFDTATNTESTLISDDDAAGIAVLPDQGPVAAFSATTATAGQATAFDASASSDPDGKVASYRWDFGDGITQTTNTPTVSHSYATPGSYKVTLTVTDNDGCSTTVVFTGQTASCNGGPRAQTTHTVTVTSPPAPPTAPAPPPAAPPPTPAAPAPSVAAPAAGPARISGIRLSAPTVTWCKHCTYPGTKLAFDLSARADVRLTLMAKVHGRWRQVAITTLHAHRGHNRFRVAGRWHSQLVPRRATRLLVALEHGSIWTVVGKLKLTVHSPYTTKILSRR